MSNKRQQILKTFEGIPAVICEADRCCEFCPTDESLQCEVMELYIAILIAIMDMMEWLVETGGCRSPSTVMSQTCDANGMKSNK